MIEGKSDMGWVYRRAGSVNRLIAELQTSQSNVAEELAQVMKSARERAETEGRREAASYVSHQAVIDYVKEHYPDLLSRLTGSDGAKNSTVH